MSQYYKHKVKRSVKQVPRSEVKYIFHSDYWDGPLSGACMFNGEKLWFHCFHDGLNCRKFILLRISKEKWEEIDKSHALFQNYVGTHTDYDESGERNIGSPPLIKHNPDKFYNWAAKNPSVDPDGESVGWYRTPCTYKSEEKKADDINE